MILWLIIDVSDHFGTLSKIEGITWQTEKLNCFYRKTNLNDEKWAQFNLDFQESLKTNIPSPHLLDPNCLANCINDTYREIIDKYMPLKKRPLNPKYKDDRPWITSGLKTSINKMYELLRISKQTGLTADYHKYKTYLNKLTSLKRNARSSYWKNETRLYGQNKAKIWQFVNKISHFKRKSSTSIKSLVDKHGKKLTESPDIANFLNNHFGSIGKTMSEEFDKMDSTRLKNPLT